MWPVPKRHGLYPLAADSVLDLAFDLFGLALCLELRVANHLADCNLDLALGDLCRTEYAILIHGVVFFMGTCLPSVRRAASSEPVIQLIRTYGSRSGFEE
jgi:hypothetical protein